MAVTKLTELDQSKFLIGGGPAQHGICYYMCDYMENHVNSPWKKPASFVAAKTGVTRMPTVAVVNAGRSYSLRKVLQLDGYTDALPLKDNSIYRVWLEVDAGKGLTGHPNHETMMLTGSGEIILFDPNFGFYHLDNIAGNAYHTAFETQLTTLYGATAIGTFGYKRKRKAF
jgi:hypothetical protein